MTKSLHGTLLINNNVYILVFLNMQTNKHLDQELLSSLILFLCAYSHTNYNPISLLNKNIMEHNRIAHVILHNI